MAKKISRRYEMKPEMMSKRREEEGDPKILFGNDGPELTRPSPGISPKKLPA
jgi:hypothetical protein